MFVSHHNTIPPRAYEMKAYRLLGMFLICFSMSSLAFAQSQLITLYPFSSEDPIVGFALSDVLQDALTEYDDFHVLDSIATPGLIPPFIILDGFASPLSLISHNDLQAAIESVEGARVLREAYNSFASFTGELRLLTEGFELEVNISHSLRDYSYTLRANDLDNLANRMLASIATELKLPLPQTVQVPPLEGDYFEYLQNLALSSTGFLHEAHSRLSRSQEQRPLLAKEEALLEDLNIAFGQERVDSDRALRIATFLLGLGDDNFDILEHYLEHNEAFAFASLWLAALSEDSQYRVEAYNRSAVYPYGQAAKLSYEVSMEQAEVSSFRNALRAETALPLFVGMVNAQRVEDITLEKDLAQRLTQVAPRSSYAFERLSYIAFDEGNALGAVQALISATGLVPESSLYWTNLGWAYYLLKLYDKSESASIQAVELEEEAFIAWYNLGLVQVVTERLEEAMLSYAKAVTYDPNVHDEAIVDLYTALEEHPDNGYIHYPLATLLEIEGEREGALEQYQLFANKHLDADFIALVERRITALSAPPARLEISAPLEMYAPEAPSTAIQSFKAGNRVLLRFEVSTPDFELPSRLDVTFNVIDDKGIILDENQQRIDIETDVIAKSIDSLAFSLNPDFTAGNYQLEVAIDASFDRSLKFTVDFEVAGKANLNERLLSHGVILRRLDDMADFSEISGDDDELIAYMLEELQNLASSAEDLLPQAETPRFQGLSGAEIFRNSTEDDIRNFLHFALDGILMRDVDISFVDFYAEWALQVGQ